jgi:hypothetical protein
MHNLLKLVFAVACGLSLALPAAAEDLTIAYKVTVRKPYIVGPANGIATLWISANKVRWFDRTYGDKIYEVTTGRIIRIDHEKKTYSETTPEQREAELQLVRQRAEQIKLEERERLAKAGEEADNPRLSAEVREPDMNAADQQQRIQELKKEIEKLPPEERERIRKQLPALQAKMKKMLEEAKAKSEELLSELPQELRDNLRKPIPPIPVDISSTIQKGTAHREIAGYRCEQHLISSTHIFADGSEKIMSETEMWGAPELELPVSLEKISEIALLPRADAKSGLSLESHTWEYGENGKELGYSMQATEIKKGEIDASIFDVPAAYAKVEPYTVKDLYK